jgi:hypothetical protein
LDPDPQDPHGFRPPESGSISQRYGSGSGSSPFLIKMLSGLKDCLQKMKFWRTNFSKNNIFKTADNVPAGTVSYKKIWQIFASLKSLKKGVGSGVGSGSAPKCHGSPTLFSTSLSDPNL